MTLPVFLWQGSAAVGDEISLDGPEGHHAATVRRLRVGEGLELVDGAGQRIRGQVVAVGKSAVRVLVGSVDLEPAAGPRLTVVQALPKGDRGELAVELLTEVGVDVVVPWQAERCVTRWSGERGEKGLARWRSSAREAAKQARRAHHPVVTDLASTDAVCALGPTFVLHEAAAARLVVPTGPVTLVVGPEGGVTDDELAAFSAAGATVVQLGSSVMRTSTAGVVGAAVVLAATRWA